MTPEAAKVKAIEASADPLNVAVPVASAVIEMLRVVASVVAVAAFPLMLPSVYARVLVVQAVPAAAA